MATKLTWIVNAIPLSRNGQYCKTCPNDDRANLLGRIAPATQGVLRSGEKDHWPVHREPSPLYPLSAAASPLRGGRHVLGIAVLDDRRFCVLPHRINDGLQEGRECRVVLVESHPDGERDVSVGNAVFGILRNDLEIGVLLCQEDRQRRIERSDIGAAREHVFQWRFVRPRPEQYFFS